jgi:hypothetical protein
VGEPIGRLDGEDVVVELRIPARPELLSLPRMTAAAVAAQAGFDIEEVEDVRLAIEELCLATSEGRGDGLLALRLELDGDALRAVCRFESENGAGPPAARSDLATELTEQLLEALADEHGVDSPSGNPSAWFRKFLPRRASA